MPPTLRWRDKGLRFTVGGAAVVLRPQLSCVRVPGTPRAQTFGFPLGFNHQRGLSHQTGLAAIAKGSEIRIGLPTTRGHQRVCVIELGYQPPAATRGVSNLQSASPTKGSSFRVFHLSETVALQSLVEYTSGVGPRAGMAPSDLAGVGRLLTLRGGLEDAHLFAHPSARIR